MGPSRDKAAPSQSNYIEESTIVAFSGHRSLDAPDKIGTSIKTVLETLVTRHKIKAVASVAAGSDVLFCEAARELGIPLQIILPFSEEEFAKDFSTPFDSWWPRSKRLIDHSRANKSLSTSPPQPSRNQAYLQCGQDCLDQAKLLIAVASSQARNSGVGSHAMIDHARRKKMYTIIIDSQSALASWPDAST